MTMMRAKRRFAKGLMRWATLGTVVLALLVVPMSCALTEKPSLEHQTHSGPTDFIRDRVESAENLKLLGRAMLDFVYDPDKAKLHFSRLRDLFDQLRDHCPEDLLSWANKSVRLNRDLLGKQDLDSGLDPIPVLAYDQDFLKQGKGTNALYLDGHVHFVDSKDLHELSSFMRDNLVFIEACYYKIPAESNDVLVVTAQSNRALVRNGGLTIQYLSNEAIDRIQELLKPRLVSSPSVLARDGKEASMAMITEEYFYLGNSKKTRELAEIQLGYKTKITPEIIGETNNIMLNIGVEVSERPDRKIPKGSLPPVTRRTATNVMTVEEGLGILFSFPSVLGWSHHFTFKVRRLTRPESLLRTSALKEK
jgi:prepilin-type processing-associated H-X9-DG protein